VSKREIPYYSDYISENFKNYLKSETKDFPGVEGLTHIGNSGGPENTESMQFVCDLYTKVKVRLNETLESRIKDRAFIDQRVKAYYQYNTEQGIDFLNSDYKTVLGDEDENGRIVIGQKLKNYCGKSSGAQVAPIPEHLEGFHVTLFGPPDDTKLSINAMNAFYRKLKDEPAIVEEILKTSTDLPKWGADNEDSKTPLRSDLITAAENLTGCFNGDISFNDTKRNKSYELEKDKLSQPIKRFTGLALPTSFMFYNGNPLPLHLYDFALHIFHHYKNPKALTFYVPKLENEEEAAYIKFMIETAEIMITKIYPEYKMGTVRLIIVLENPRAVFRVNEMMDELYPYFVGASLGWHDYLGSTARLFKEDGNYRIPVKADPDIVIKYIKASHELLANVVGERGGVKIGGMYGILPIDNDLSSESFQLTIRGFFRDVLTQMKRNLSGYWVAHPDFIRIGIAIVEAWKFYAKGEEDKLKGIIDGLLNEGYAKEIWAFVKAEDIKSLDIDDPMYARKLIVADINESDFIANNHPDEIRYNIFQMLQYLTDWLSGNGCVALPTQIKGVPARVMDDLATAERSRWEVWHEIRHNRFSVEEFLQTTHEEMNFIRRDLSNDKKIVQIKYTAENAKWYDVAVKLMIQLMTSKSPVEFATELLMPFTIDSIRDEKKPWDKLNEIDSKKYYIEKYVERYNYYYEMCGAHSFAKENAINTVVNIDTIKSSVLGFDKSDVLSSASFHGDIGQALKTLDAMAQTEQKEVANSDEQVRNELVKLTQDYLAKFGVKYLVSAKNKSAKDLLENIKTRINNTEIQELENSKKALLEITLKRIEAHPRSELHLTELSDIFDKSKVTGCQIAISSAKGHTQTLCFGTSDLVNPITETTKFQIASLSKTYASVLAFEYFNKNKIPLDSKVNDLFQSYGSDFRLKGEWAKEVEINHLMSHSALNMHYVNGVPRNLEMPNISDFLEGNETFGYLPVEIINEPGSKFNYSGAGFIVLEYLIELISGKSINQLSHYDFTQKIEEDRANGYTDNKSLVEQGYKMFPAFAAGMWNTASAVNELLEEIAVAYNELSGSKNISHDTAVQMTYGSDKGCKEFMNALMGHGVFTVEAGDNEFLLHQGANDGFRAIYLYCYKGPDVYKGVTILCNGENDGVILNSLLIQKILKELDFEGIDYSKFESNFSIDTVEKQEEIVNLGYKNLVLNAFLPTVPEPIENRNKIDPRSGHNLLKNAQVISLSNEKFAGAINLTSEFEPVFDPSLFGTQGKVMDSWESTRHNISEYDFVKFKLNQTSDINFVSISTKFHDGNQVEEIEILANGKMLLEKTKLDGHALRLIKLAQGFKDITEVEFRVFPDGGLTRIGLYEHVEDENSFFLNSEAKNIRFNEKIPDTTKPLGPNLNSVEFLAKVLSASDEHYAPAINVLSPIPPLNMFDGLESKRSRDPLHKEELIIELKESKVIKDLTFDFTYFVNNNPKFLSVSSEIDGEWVSLIDKFFCKPYAGNKLKLNLNNEFDSKVLKFNFYPDGGVNRIII
jgi:malate synthase/allantoicase/2-oxo-4-hydroxy-4-carboxy--5-ureidoimidazoline (OHCU) decarboxylase